MSRFQESKAFIILLTKSQALLHSIIGPSRIDIFPLAYSMALTADRLYMCKIPLREFSVYNDIYHEVSKKLMLKQSSAARSVERLAKLFGDELSAQGRVEDYIGRPLKDLGSARTLVIYLATYVYFGKPYFQVLEEAPELLIDLQPAEKTPPENDTPAAADHGGGQGCG